MKHIIYCKIFGAEFKSGGRIPLAHQDFKISKSQNAKKTVYGNIWGYVL